MNPHLALVENLERSLKKANVAESLEIEGYICGFLALNRAGSDAIVQKFLAIGARLSPKLFTAKAALAFSQITADLLKSKTEVVLTPTDVCAIVDLLMVWYDGSHEITPLRALTAVLLQNSARLPARYAKLGPWLRANTATHLSADTRRFAVLCLGHLFVGAGSKMAAQFEPSIECLLGFAREWLDRSPAMPQQKCLNASMTALCHLLEETKANPQRRAVEGRTSAVCDLLFRCLQVQDMPFSWKIRFHAVEALAALSKASKVFPSLWNPFMADEGSPPSLLSLLRFDMESRVRHAASAALVSVYRHHRQLFRTAQVSRSATPASFIPLSQWLAELLRNHHIALARVLAPAVLQQSPDIPMILQTFSALIQHTPYAQLDPVDTLGIFLPQLQRALELPVAEVKVAVLLAFASILSLPPLPFLQSMLNNSLIELLLPSSPPTVVAVASLELCSRLVTHYFDVTELHWDRVTRLLESSLAAEEAILRQAAAAFVESASRATGAQSGELGLLDASEFWKWLLRSTWPSLAEDSQPATRALVASALVFLPDRPSTQMSDSDRVGLTRLPLALVSDSHPSVRAAAFAALGHLVLLEVLRQDALFFSDVARTILTGLVDPSPPVRAKVSFALGSMAQVIQTQPLLLPSALLKVLFEGAIRALDDSDKISTNAIRALGFFARVEPAWLPAVVQLAFHKLKLPGHTAKLEWNICRMFCQLPLPGLRPSAPALVVGMLPLLTRANYKVRLSALAALRHLAPGVGPEVRTSVYAALYQLAGQPGPLDPVVGQYRAQLEEELQLTVALFSS
jgi:hypothetical protein